MNISLTAELRQLVTRKVESGLYSSASEVVREALRLLQERDQLRELRREQLRVAIAKGMAELDAGLGEELTYNLVADIKQMGRSRAADGDQ